MKSERIKIHLLPAPDDAPLESSEYQAELDAFDRILRTHKIVPQRVLGSLEAAAGGSEPAVWLSQFVIVAQTLTPIIVPAICTAIHGYFNAKPRRGVTFEMDGRIKGRADTIEDAERLLQQLITRGQKQVPKKAAKKKSDGEKPPVRKRP